MDVRGGAVALHTDLTIRVEARRNTGPWPDVRLGGEHGVKDIMLTLGQCAQVASTCDANVGAHASEVEG